MNLELPRPFTFDSETSVRDFWVARLRQHTTDWYRGRPLQKMPEDLRTYQHVIEASRPTVIVELGTYGGGSAVWFADQLDAICGGGRVITIDVLGVRIDDPRITTIQSDVTAARPLVDVAPHERVMVVEDSAHVYETTRAALDRYSDLVSPGCWFVVEDGVVDDEALSFWNERGVQPAIADFLETPAGARFRRHWLAPYGLTTDHGGWLEAAA